MPASAASHSLDSPDLVSWSQMNSAGFAAVECEIQGGICHLGGTIWGGPRIFSMMITDM